MRQTSLSLSRSPRVWLAILAGLAMLAGAVGLGLTVGSLGLMAVFASIAGLGIALAIGSIVSYCRSYTASSVAPATDSSKTADAPAALQAAYNDPRLQSLFRGVTVTDWRESIRTSTDLTSSTGSATSTSYDPIADELARAAAAALASTTTLHGRG